MTDMQRIEKMVQEQGLELSDLTYLLDEDDDDVEGHDDDSEENDNELDSLDLMELDEE